MSIVTPGARKVLEFVRSELSKGKRWPTKEEVCKVVGWKHTGSVQDAYHRLTIAKEIVVLDREPSGRGWIYHYALADQVEGAE